MTGFIPIISSAKSPSDWAYFDLEAFNIQVETLDATDFFNIPQLPPSTASSVILNNSTEPEICTTMDSLFFLYLKRAMPGQRWNSGDLAAFILRMLKYEKRGCAVATSDEMGFEMCGQFVGSAPDLCITELCQCLLLVEYGQSSPISAHELQPVLIARAIAAFYHNRFKGMVSEEKIFPGIIMAGTTPIFYKIHITQSLLDHIARGQRPAVSTVIERCFPPVESIAAYIDYGMCELEYRGVALQCFEAFKTLL